jgi:putative membrane protein (TIGR04086 family)
MSFDFSTLKWTWIIVGTIVGLVLTMVLQLVFQFGYGLAVGIQMRGTPPQEVLIAAFTSPLFQALFVLLAGIGVVMGARLAGRRSEDNPQLAGLIVGVLAAVILAVLAPFPSGAEGLWVILGLIVNLVAGWLGGWLASRRKVDEPQAVYQ